MAGNKVTLSNHSELFKEFYVPIMEAAINTATPMRTQIKRIKNFTGKQITGVARRSRGGGSGNAVIPASSTRKSDPISYTPRSLWQTSVLDWEAMVASGDDKGAFVDVTVDEVEGCMENFTANESRQIFGTSAGILGVLNAVPTSAGGGVFTFSISDATWFSPNWEEGDVINFHTDTDGFEITAVSDSAQDITVSRRAGGSFDPTTLAGTENIYKQNSKDVELTGLKDIADATVGVTSLYGLTAGRRWIARVQDLSAAPKPLIPDMLTQMCALHHDATGMQYSSIVMNAIQYNDLENQLEGKKEYTQLKSNDSRYADMGWEALTIRSRGEKVSIFTDLFCPKDRVYFITASKQEMRERPKFGWLEHDGKQYLREFYEGQTPRYKAVYGGYEQYFHHPAYLGCIKGLAVPTSS